MTKPEISGLWSAFCNHSPDNNKFFSLYNERNLAISLNLFNEINFTLSAPKQF